MTLEKGQLVEIYIDPVTQHYREGVARLIKKLHETPDQEYWRVEFIADEDIGTYNRWVQRSTVKPLLPL